MAAEVIYSKMLFEIPNLCCFPEVGFLMTEWFSERASRENLLLKMFSWCVSVYITVLWLSKLFPSGPSVLTGDSLASLETDLGPLSFVHCSAKWCSRCQTSSVCHLGKVLKSHGIARANAPFARVWSRTSLGLIALGYGMLLLCVGDTTSTV